MNDFNELKIANLIKYQSSGRSVLLYLGQPRERRARARARQPTTTLKKLVFRHLVTATFRRRVTITRSPKSIAPLTQIPDARCADELAELGCATCTVSATTRGHVFGIHILVAFLQ